MPIMLKNKANILLCFDFDDTATIRIPIVKAIIMGMIGVNNNATTNTKKSLIVTDVFML